MKTQRLYFIDAVRAFAILMMLQGHFIDTLIDPIYKNPDSTVYNIWSYFRGITAPTFFTISGLIFAYLLLKAKHKGSDKERIKKGLWRGLMLIGIGYALRIPILAWFAGSFNLYFLVIDVLQCIGLSLILLILCYLLTLKKPLLFGVALLLLGTFCFATEPWYRDLTLENTPRLVANYFSKSNGSVFTILPWFGYTAFGGFLAVMFFRHLEKKKFKAKMIFSFLVSGFILIYCSSLILFYLFKATGIQVLYDAANYNYLFTRFGNVLILFAVFYSFERFMKQSIVNKIGQKTLSIYVIHFIIIYGSFTGFGLNRIIGKTLTPWQTIFGALTFLIIVTLIAIYRTKTNAFIYKNLRKLIDKVKKS